MAKQMGGTTPRMLYSARGGKVLALAAREMAHALHAMIGERITPESSREVVGRRIQLEFGRAARLPFPALSGDSYVIARGGETVTIDGGSDRALLHAVYDLLGRLGVRHLPGRAPEFPRIDPAMLRAVEPLRVEPAFARRAFVSDIMTWNYEHADRLEAHLAFDREFIPWMAARGINAFFYLRQAHDTRLRVDELAALCRERGIASEYGGHVIKLLLPRDLFQSHPQYFAAGPDGKRTEAGNLCVSNRAALDLAKQNALSYVRDYPENEMLHIWGADVQDGAWCRCGDCKKLTPQLQYMKVVNEIAGALGGDGPPVAYLAYHDTLEPDSAIRPAPNVWFEWAPRERCYSHAIDDPACETNPRYFESLKKYLELFEGRGHAFEYYQDAILFGGLGFATPAIIARDLRAYRALGLAGVSCLTFGAFSQLAYPVNANAFARGTRDPGFDPGASLADTAAERHPACAPEIARAYQTIEKASAKVLTYADVMRPQMPAEKAKSTRAEIKEAAGMIRSAIQAAAGIVSQTEVPILGAERELWEYSAEVLEGITDYLGAKELSGAPRKNKGETAIAKIDKAAERIRSIDPTLKGTWGQYDFEWIRGLWLEALRRNLEEAEAPAQGAKEATTSRRKR